ncbi:MAG: exodeoxyribonuclease VII small subunit [Candidatus Saccharimonadales bacterium]
MAKIDYHALNQELQTILTALESDDLDIEASIVQYKRGMEIVSQLQAYLKSAQTTVDKVKASWK